MRRFGAAVIVLVAACSSLLGISDVKHRDGGPGQVDATGDSLLIDAATDAATDAPADALTANRIVFVTSATFSGNLGGLSGADAKCQSLAGSASLTGTYRAWLSDNVTNAASRLTHTTGDYTLVAGTVVAHGFTGSQGLTSMTLRHAIDRTEGNTAGPATGTGCATVGSGTFVYTGTTPDGSSGLNNCSNWTTTSGTVDFGDYTAASSSWTDGCSRTGCNSVYALYCIEQ